jgi:hypothetical protein
VSLAEDTNTLRASLLAYIQDDEFEIVVRDMIIHKAHIDVVAILNKLRERDMALNAKDQNSTSIGGIGSTSTRYARRTQLALLGHQLISNGTFRGSQIPGRRRLEGLRSRCFLIGALILIRASLRSN